MTATNCRLHLTGLWLASFDHVGVPSLVSLCHVTGILRPYWLRERQTSAWHLQPRYLVIVYCLLIWSVSLQITITFFSTIHGHVDTVSFVDISDLCSAPYPLSTWHCPFSVWKSKEHAPFVTFTRLLLSVAATLWQEWEEDWICSLFLGVFWFIFSRSCHSLQRAWLEYSGSSSRFSACSCFVLLERPSLFLLP